MHLNRLRLAGLVGAALYAALAIGAGLDRMSEADPALANSVPGPMRITAARMLAQQEIAANRPLDAMASARIAIARDPANVQALAQMGQAQILAKQLGGARATYTVTDRMGWREPSTQVFWLLEALGRKDYVDATKRLDAVLRQAPKFPQRDQLLAMFEGWPLARDQMARRLALDPDWKQAYFQDLDTLSPSTLYLRGEVARRLAKYEKGERDCTLVAPLVWLMPSRLGYPEAYDVWKDYCRVSGSSSLVADPGFEHVRLAEPITPFDWRFPQRGEIDVLQGAQGGFTGKALTVSSTAPGRRSFARQLLQLPPGRYNVTWRALDAGDAPSNDLTVSLQCIPDVHEPLKQSILDRKRGRFGAETAVVPGCVTQWLDLAIAGRGGPVTIDDVNVAPVR